MRLKKPSARKAAKALHATDGFEASIDRAEYRRQFERIQAYIRAGDCYQVNYTQRFAARVEGDAWQAYREMRARNPVPFGAFLHLDDIEILSFSLKELTDTQGYLEALDRNWYSDDALLGRLLGRYAPAAHAAAADDLESWGATCATSGTSSTGGTPSRPSRTSSTAPPPPRRRLPGRR